MKKLNKKGFSLVELMVVVAIIGILSAIAIPNFQRFQRKSRQSEAKSTLGGIYSAEKAFHTEWNIYYGMLDTVGYVPSGTLLYNAGFTAAGTALPAGYNGGLVGSTYVDTSQECAVGTPYVTQCKYGGSAASTAPTAAANPALQGDLATFTAAAITVDSRINRAAGTNDEWSMSQNGTLTNNTEGI